MNDDRYSEVKHLGFAVTKPRVDEPRNSKPILKMVSNKKIESKSSTEGEDDMNDKQLEELKKYFSEKIDTLDEKLNTKIDNLNEIISTKIETVGNELKAHIKSENNLLEAKFSTTETAVQDLKTDIKSLPTRIEMTSDIKAGVAISKVERILWTVSVVVLIPAFIWGGLRTINSTLSQFSQNQTTSQNQGAPTPTGPAAKPKP